MDSTSARNKNFQ